MWSVLHTLKLAELWDCEWVIEWHSRNSFDFCVNLIEQWLGCRQPQCHSVMLDQYASPLKHNTRTALHDHHMFQTPDELCSRASLNRIELTPPKKWPHLLQSYNKPGPISGGLNQYNININNNSNKKIKKNPTQLVKRQIIAVFITRCCFLPYLLPDDLSTQWGGSSAWLRTQAPECAHVNHIPQGYWVVHILQYIYGICVPHS